MIIDEVVWQIINQSHCSFRVKTIEKNFCRNEHNVTGFCNRQSCPLANSQYATVMHEKGVCYLYIKTAERSHSPKNMWEKIQLDKNYQKALGQINDQLEYWPKFLRHKCKQRLTKLRQMLIRIRKMRLKGQDEVVALKKKVERREKVREIKAEVAANVEDAIEKELLERLKVGVYSDIYNFNKKAFHKMLDRQLVEDEDEILAQREEEQIQNGEDDVEFIYDPDEDDGEGDEDEDIGDDDGEGIEDEDDEEDDGQDVQDEEDDDNDNYDNEDDEDDIPKRPASSGKRRAQTKASSDDDESDESEEAKPNAKKQSKPAPKKGKPEKKRKMVLRYEERETEPAVNYTSNLADF